MTKQFFLFLFFFSSFLFSQTVSPKFETRAVWISAASGDWPTSTDVDKQQQSLIEILDVIRSLKFNTVFFQVRPRGNTLYRSEIEPWAAQLTGILGKDPGWDPLEFAIEQAHKRGLELHAWINIGKIYNAELQANHKNHLLNTHPEWLKKFGKEWWIDLGIPAARDYTKKVVMEVVNNYDVDGIHFDYIRYPGKNFDDWKTFREFSDGIERNEWRRNNITAFVRDAYVAITSVKPHVKIGSAPIGIYQTLDGAQSSFSGMNDISQDSRRWLKEGIHDYVAPQLYWSFGEQKNPNDPDFGALCNDWSRERYGRSVFIGIGAYRENIQDEIAEQIRFTREAGAQGQSIFRYENLNAVKEEIRSAYRFRAMFAPMPWKDSIPPLPPENVKIIYDENAAIIKWSEPKKAKDKELPFWYAVYRSTDENVNTKTSGTLLAILPSSQRSFRDETLQDKKYFYAITSLDRCGNESTGKEQRIVEAENILTRYLKSKNEISLSESFPNPFSARTFISFELPKRSTVEITLKNIAVKQETTLVREIKEAGAHIVVVDGKNLSNGKYELQLKAGEKILKKNIEKR